jgi:hypothetical protein
MISSVVKCLATITLEGQEAAQVPQPLHKASFIKEIPFSALKEMAS